MKKRVLCVATSLIILSGCATNDDVELNEVETKTQPSMTIDENGLITDDSAFIEISESDYKNDMEYILTDGKFNMRLNEASKEDQENVKLNNTIYFKFDSAEISEEMKKIVESQYNFLIKYPKIKVILEGHTDEKGSNSYNVILGEKRANEVKKLFISKGIFPEQIEVISYGEMKPISTGIKPSDDAQNRRVVFTYQ